MEMHAEKAGRDFSLWRPKANFGAAGDCWLQPQSIVHKVLDYSDGCEVLEIVLPADFKTVELEK